MSLLSEARLSVLYFTIASSTLCTQTQCRAMATYTLYIYSWLYSPPIFTGIATHIRIVTESSYARILTRIMTLPLCMEAVSRSKVA